MQKIKNLINLLFIIALFLSIFALLGCVSQEQIVKSHPDVNAYLEKHPTAVFTIHDYSKERFEEEKVFWEMYCKGKLESKEYFFVLFEDNVSTFKGLFDRGDMHLYCGVIEDKENNQTNDSDNISVYDNTNSNTTTPQTNTNPNSNTTPQTSAPDTNTNVPTCEEVWMCSTWSVCSNGKQRQLCELVFDCEGYDSNNPSVQRNC